jgi:hypothetical protein
MNVTGNRKIKTLFLYVNVVLKGFFLIIYINIFEANNPTYDIKIYSLTTGIHFLCDNKE